MATHKSWPPTRITTTPISGTIIELKQEGITPIQSVSGCMAAIRIFISREIHTVQTTSMTPINSAKITTRIAATLNRNMMITKPKTTTPDSITMIIRVTKTLMKLTATALVMEKSARIHMKLIMANTDMFMVVGAATLAQAIVTSIWETLQDRKQLITWCWCWLWP